MAATLIAIGSHWNRIDNWERFFQLFTFQFILDENFKPWMISVQPSVYFRPGCKIDTDIKMCLVNEIIDKIEPQLEVIRSKFSAIPTLKVVYKKAAINRQMSPTVVIPKKTMIKKVSGRGSFLL